MNIALLISGGVDSSVACYELINHGITPDLWYIKIGSDKDETLTCTAEEDIEMATAIAHKFGLKLNIIDLHEDYWTNVVDYTMTKVREGLTPNPDVMCNYFIKFGAFIDKVGNKYDRIATGHYGRILRGDDVNNLTYETLDNFTELTGKIWLGSAVDPRKDQTDFLCMLNDYQMSKIMLPIGHLNKSEVRKIAEDNGLVTAKRKDSQGICFLGRINYNQYIESYLGKKEGKIVDINTNTILGNHNGHWFHTIGQRRGLNLPNGPWYVCKKNPKRNIVYVTNSKDYLKLINGSEIIVDGFNWSNNIENWGNCKVRIRHTSAPQNAIIGVYYNHDNMHIKIIPDNKIDGIAPGQFAVVYSPDGKVVLGAGEITINKGVD